jgi:hypothetical protein
MLLLCRLFSALACAESSCCAVLCRTGVCQACQAMQSAAQAQNAELVCGVVKEGL